MKRILIVDDEKMVRDVIQDFFSACGYEVVTAMNGMDAMEKFAPGSFDCIISDCEMPEMNGAELLGLIRSRDEGVVFFLITGAPDHKRRQESLEMGADAFILKPLSMVDVITRVERAIDKRRSSLPGPDSDAGIRCHPEPPFCQDSDPIP